MPVFTKICELVHSLTGVPVDSLDESTRVSDLALDDLDIEEIFLELEELYDVVLDDDAKPNTICDMIDMVNSGLAAA